MNKLNRLNRSFAFLCALGVAVLLGLAPPSPPVDGAPAEPEKEPAKWIPLFNGKDLSGWTPKFTHHPLGENYNDTFRVEDGLLRVRYDKWDRFNGTFGHLIFKQPFSHYRLRAEYRFVGEQSPGGPGWAWRNNGLMIHGQPPETMMLDQEFPVSIEVQLLGGDGTNERPTANLCTPGTLVVLDGKLFTPHCTNSKSPTFPGDQWVTVEVEVLGGEVIRHIIDGRVVLEYASPQLDRNDPDAKKLIHDDKAMLSEGYISIQAESHPTDFRRIEIQLIEDDAPDEPRP